MKDPGQHANANTVDERPLRTTASRFHKTNLAAALKIGKDALKRPLALPIYPTIKSPHLERVNYTLIRGGDS